MTSLKKKLLYCLAFLLVYSSCKKGEDDPFISLRTRKARLCGTWHLESGNLKLSSKKPGVSYGDANYTYTKNSYTLVNTGNASNYKGDYSLELTITKDGTFNFKEKYDALIVSANGTWDFLAGIGEYKNKERVAFKVTSITGGSGWLDAFNKARNYFIYNIRELRNKKIVLETIEELAEVSDVDGVSTYITDSYVLTQ